MQRTPKVRFFLEKRKDKTTGLIVETGVPVLFNLNAGIRVKSTTGVVLGNSSHWDSIKSRVKTNVMHSAMINKQLSDLRTELENLCYEAWDKDIRLTTQYVLTNLKKNQQSKSGFFDRFDEFIESGKKKWAPGTVKKFLTIKNHLQKFGEKKKFAVGFNQLDEIFFEKFMGFYFEGTDKRPGLRNTYVRKNIKFIKSFLAWATKKGYNKNLDYLKFKLETGQKSEKNPENIVALTIAEFLHIFKMNIQNETMQKTRDFLMLACSTGLRFSDIASLRKIDIDYSSGVISVTTIKTGSYAKIPFNEFSRSVLEKYRFETILNSKGIEMAIPTTSNTRTNINLKKLGKAAGLNTMVTKIHFRQNQRIETVCPKHNLITSHIGRRTFITLNIFLGLKSEILMGLTTHKSHETMENYYSVDLGMKQKAMNNFNLQTFEELTKDLPTN